MRGLKGAAHHNGKMGQVEAYDADTGRYAVRLANGEGVKIKFDNLLCVLATMGLEPALWRAGCKHGSGAALR